VGLIARIIEEGGIPTITIGSCRDIMALVKPPRAIFVDFPLGHQCGKPYDTALQMRILKDTLKNLVEASVPGEIVDLTYSWGEPFDWESYERNLMEMIKEESHAPPAWVPKK